MSREAALRSVRPAVVVWAVLVVATMLSWWLGDAYDAGALGGVLVLLVAFVKIFLIGDYFMELRVSVLALRLVFGGWCVVLWAVLTSLYLFA